MKIFKEHLKKYLSDKEIEDLISSFENEAKSGLLLNEYKMNEETLLGLYPHLTRHPFIKNAFLFDKNEYQLGKSIYHELGCFYIQEPSAMMVSYLLNADKDDLVLDLCAAPGGKTIGTALNMENNGLIIANDISKDRSLILKENIARLGIRNTIVTSNDFSKIYQNYLSAFDKIILDAPCSGSGMFRKDNKMLDDWNINKVIKNSLIQMELITIAYQMLKPGGTLIYSTCSYSYEEDEEVIKYLLANSDASLIPIKDSNLFYKSKENIGVHLFPNLFPGEGHYICLIKKNGYKNNTKFKKGNFKLPLSNDIELTLNTSKFYNDILGIENLINYKNLYIIKYGFKIGTQYNKDFVYDYEYAHILKEYKFSIDLNKQEATRYIKGEQLIKENSFKGNVVLTYQNIPIDFAKTDGKNIKNHYPKNLRKNII